MKKNIYLTVLTISLSVFVAFAFVNSRESWQKFAPIRKMKIPVETETIIHVPSNQLTYPGRYLFIFTTTPQDAPNLLKWDIRDEIAVFGQYQDINRNSTCLRGGYRGVAQLDFKLLSNGLFWGDYDVTSCVPPRYVVHFNLEQKLSDLTAVVEIKPIDLSGDNVFLTVVNIVPELPFQIEIIWFVYVLPVLAVTFFLIDLIVVGVAIYRAHKKGE